MKKYDVAVIGGGFAGVAAALAAARGGAKVLIVEKSNCLGGAAVNCLVNPFMQYWTEMDGKRVDLSAGMVAIKGWREVSALSCDEFFTRLEGLGVKTVICTDISKDGLLGGTNIELYKALSEKFSIDIIASGGVTSLDDVRKLRDMNMYGAILGKAIYAKRIDLREALAVARGEKE